MQGVGSERGRAFLYEFESGDVGSVAFTHPLNMWANTERIEVSSPTGVLAAHNFYELRFLGDLTETYGYAVRFDNASETVWNPTFSIPYFSMSSQYLHGTQPALEAFVGYIRRGGRPRANVDTVEHTMYVKSAGREAWRKASASSCRTTSPRTGRSDPPQPARHTRRAEPDKEKRQCRSSHGSCGPGSRRA